MRGLLKNSIVRRLMIVTLTLLLLLEIQLPYLNPIVNAETIESVQEDTINVEDSVEGLEGNKTPDVSLKEEGVVDSEVTEPNNVEKDTKTDEIKTTEPSNVEKDTKTDEVKIEKPAIISKEQPEVIVNDIEGELYYNGERLYIQEEGKTVPVNINELTEEDEGKRLAPESSKNTLALASTPRMAMMTMSASSAPQIVVGRQINFRVGTGQMRFTHQFWIDGRIAFCLEQHKPGPNTGEAYYPTQPYHNDRIKRALYYGWGGPGNIFSNEDTGIIATHAVLSNIYNEGVPGYQSFGARLPGVSELTNIARNGSLPDYGISLTRSDLTSYLNGNKQVSDTTKLVADPANRISFSLPNGLTFINDSTGYVQTGGSVTISGGQSFHFVAPLNYNSDFKVNSVYGSMLSPQPLLTAPVRAGIQVLGTLKMYRDPDNFVNLTVDFWAREVTHTVKHVDKFTGNEISKTTTKRTIGSPYNVCPSTDLKVSGYPVKSEDACASGTTPSTDFTTTFYYNSSHNLIINYFDKYNNSLIKEYGKWTYKAGDSYDKTVDSSFKWGKQNTQYEVDGSTRVTGTMSRGDKIINVYYNPYHNISVNWYVNTKLNKIIKEHIPFYSFQKISTQTKNSACCLSLDLEPLRARS